MNVSICMYRTFRFPYKGKERFWEVIALKGSDFVCKEHEEGCIVLFRIIDVINLIAAHMLNADTERSNDQQSHWRHPRQHEGSQEPF